MHVNEKSPNENYLLEQNHQPVYTICNKRVGMKIICCSECHCKIHYKLRKEKQKLREENTIVKNSNKVNKANNTNKINELETQMKNLQKSLTGANRKNAKKTKVIHKLERQTPLHKVSESGQMTGDDIDFRAEKNSNLNWELGVYDDFRDFKRFVTMEFKEIKQQIHPTSRNNETFLKTKLTRKPGYIKQGT